jgi:hypothetical protein
VFVFLEIAAIILICNFDYSKQNSNLISSCAIISLKNFRHYGIMTMLRVTFSDEKVLYTPL